ncbi:MAG: hypothetical protein LLG09_05060 [Negativicutes bacterium]|nr:hypothetical protein [Negativicutes bacterium]
MNNILSLVKLYYTGVFGINKVLHSKDKKEKRNALAKSGMILFTMVIMIVYVFTYCFGIADSYGVIAGYQVILAMMMAMTSVMCFINTALKGSGMLFRSQDDDLLTSLPIPFSQLIAAKLINLYLYNLFFSAFLMIPAVIVYSLRVAVGLPFLLFSSVGILCIPVLPMITASGASILIELFSSRFRYKNLLNLVLTFAFVSLIMLGSFSLESMSMEKIITLADFIMQKIYALYPLTKLFTLAVIHGNTLYLLAFLLSALLPFAAFSWLTARYHNKIKEFLTPISRHTEYRDQTLQSSSVLKALYRKDLKYYFSCNIYVFNTIFASIMMVGAAVYLYLQRTQILLSLALTPQLIDGLYAFVPIAICAFIAMACTTSVALSLEGPMYPLLKSLPLQPIRVYLSKILVNLTITLPAVLIAVPLVALAVRLSLFHIVMSLLIPCLFAFFMAQLGILVNLSFPKFDWTSEVVMVKQSLNVIVAMLLNFLTLAAMAVPLLKTASNLHPTLLLVDAGLLVLLNGVLFRVLQGWGSKLFYQIG